MNYTKIQNKLREIGKYTQISKQRNLKRRNHKLYLHNLKIKNIKHTYSKEKLNILQWEKGGKL